MSSPRGSHIYMSTTWPDFYRFGRCNLIRFRPGTNPWLNFRQNNSVISNQFNFRQKGVRSLILVADWLFDPYLLALFFNFIHDALQASFPIVFTLNHLSWSITVFLLCKLALLYKIFMKTNIHCVSLLPRHYLSERTCYDGCIIQSFHGNIYYRFSWLLSHGAVCSERESSVQSYYCVAVWKTPRNERLSFPIFLQRKRSTCTGKSTWFWVFWSWVCWYHVPLRLLRFLPQELFVVESYKMWFTNQPMMDGKMLQNLLNWWKFSKEYFRFEIIYSRSHHH